MQGRYESRFERGEAVSFLRAISKFRQRHWGEWRAIQAWGSSTFAKNISHQMAFAAAIIFVAFHLFGFTQIILFNEDLWLRGFFNSHTILTTATVSYWSPIYYSFLAFSDAFPEVGPWAHGAAMLLFTGFLLVSIVFLRYSLGLPAWLSALAIALLTCLPAITESTYWVAATHSEIGVILYVVFLMFLPKNRETATPKNLLLAGVALVAALSGSPLNYLAVILALGILAWLAARNPKKWVSVALTILLFAGYFAWRNYLLNGDVARFSTAYNAGESFSLPRILNKLSLIISATNPLASALLSVKEKVFFEPAANSLIHLAWFVPTVFYVLLRRPDSRIVGVALYGLTTVTTQMFLNSVVMRYQLPVIFCTVVMIALSIDMLRCNCEGGWSHWASIGVLGAAFFSFSTKAVLDISAWWRYGVAESGVVELAAKHKDSSSTQIVADMDQVVSWMPQRSIFTGGTNTTIGGIRRIIFDLNLSSCIYGGTQLERTPGYYYQALSVYNSELNVLANGMWGRIPSSCPIIPPEGKRTYCYTFEGSSGLVGAYHRVKGGKLTVPWCSGGIPPEHLGPSKERSVEQCGETIVDCFDGE
jgi:hypothetical protein